MKPINPNNAKQVRLKTVFEENKKRKNGGLITMLKTIWPKFPVKVHSHEREDARRRSQIERGVILADDQVW